MRTALKFKAIGVSALAATAAISFATPSFAGTGTNCSATYKTGCISLYYNSEYANGKFSVWDQNIPDLAGYKFGGGSAGSGQAVKNNAASAKFFGTKDTTIGWNYVKIHFNSNYGGPCDMMYRNHGAPKLIATYNENASIVFDYETKCHLF
ncbi:MULTISPECIES: peptidase M23 [unclassified Streptomyces]|uniref:peptidase M23 n=1 Tax=unclassified Streptomyces TaxID=2593676 RepID=UPI002555F0E6|nr:MULTISPECIES: peptidase M23 [unclassified Streptomyces]WRZ65387.1 peptidase M23 [Streptomyces sp. NBC_01257]